jgi:chromosomal replication initiator protein
MNLSVVWEQVVRELSAGTLSPQQRAWMRVTRPIGLLDGTALLAAPSEFAKDAIERALREPITDALSRRLGRVVSLAVKVDPSSRSSWLRAPPRYPSRPTAARRHHHRRGPAPRGRALVRSSSRRWS